ncbi:MAG TPA: hypothetical protein VFA96_02650, partial [Nocardioides sp.]|nr:hypothetical protein [Nocardioides sp.]
RLTAKKRLFMATGLAQPDQDGNPVMPVDDDIILTDPAGGTLGEGAQKPPVTEVEYSYDAAPLIAHVTDLVDTIATRCGVVVQLVTQPQQLGRAESGTAIRMRFLPTVSAANGKAKPWDDQLPKILQRLALIDALPEANGGFNREYRDAGELPSVERGSILPTDEQEVVASHAQAVEAEIESRWTAIKEIHADWTDEQVQEELDRIDADRPNLPTAAPPDGAPRPPAPGELPVPPMPPAPAPTAT